MIKEKLLTFKNFLHFLNKRAHNDALFRVASALSYTSLLAIVPLLSIVLAIFSAFPIFSEFRGLAESFILKNLLPDTAQDVTTYLTSFISASGKLTAIGIASIVIVAILMLSTIENAFNFIFKAYKPRRITTKITLYWTFLTLGPLLMGVVFSLRGYLAWNPDAVINKITPTLISYITIILIYVFVPNKKIKVTHAMIGAFIATILMSALRASFAEIMSMAVTYKTLYGALSTIPVFLIWMYASWLVILFGAITTASINDFIEDKKTLDKRTNLEHSEIKAKSKKGKNNG